jgi:hypothetical protein
MKQIILSALNDAWMDNGVETIYCILQEAQDKSFNAKIENNSLIITITDFEEFKKALGVAIEQRRSNLITISMDKLGEKKEVKKDYILIQEGTKVKGKVAFKEGLYNQKTTADTISRIFDLMTEEGTRNCVICGNPFSKPVKKLQQAAYPFVTKIKSLSGVRSYKDETTYSLQEYFEDFCPACYLRGIAEWSDDGIIYRTVPGEKSTLFLPQSTSLMELAKFKKSCRDLLNKKERYQNIREEINSEKTEKTSGSLSTLLCFYEKFLIDTEEIPSRTWALMEVPFGAVKNIKFNTLNLEDSILQVMKQLSEEGIGLYSMIIKATSFFFNNNSKGPPVNWDLTNEVRENLSKAFLENDFRSFARTFTPKKGGHIGFSKETRTCLERLIYIWRLEKMGLDEENLKMLKTAGRTIAVASKSHQSLLYKLDKAKDKTALLDAIRQVSRRIAGLKTEEKEKYKTFVYPPALEELVMLLEKHETDRRFIEDLKNIIVIFSCVELSRLDYLGERKEVKGND